MPVAPAKLKERHQKNSLVTTGKSATVKTVNMELDKKHDVIAATEPVTPNSSSNISTRPCFFTRHVVELHRLETAQRNKGQLTVAGTHLSTPLHTAQLQYCHVRNLKGSPR